MTSPLDAGRATMLTLVLPDPEAPVTDDDRRTPVPLTLITGGRATSATDGNDDRAWRDQALCAQTDPEAFFPEKGGSTRDAKGICTGCEVRAECLEYALANDERFGIWGGLSERERRRLRQSR